MPEIVFDEIMVTYKHMIDDKIKSLMTDKLRVSDEETDIDWESRQFQLKELKKWAQEML